MNFIGEHVLPGQIGRLCVIISLVSSLLATVSYALGTVSANGPVKSKWLRIGRIAFIVEAAAVAGIAASLFYIISHHLFEYAYAWRHSSVTLEARYLLACFWEGQEGSFILWSFWHCILGIILICRSGSWEGPVMAVISFAQFCLATMIMGISIAGIKIGSGPFILLRNELQAPVFSRSDYLSLIKDGNGLNPLLQNYWMVIHPPVLFLGFATAIVPFAYAIAGLWTKQYSGWIKAAIPWALTCCAILGTGIMMGAMWAYESLTFGGYWAWDPVENASLVPWLIMAAGIHTMLVQQRTGRSLRISAGLVISSFLLVLYSTFLTRSGILGESSVHAFTDLEMNTQLLSFFGVFVVGAAVLFGMRYRHMPQVTREEDVSSREFWMFIGSLVLFISALTIIIMTSIPVFNKIAGFFTRGKSTLFKPLAIGEDSEYSYNKIQIYIAISIGLLTGVSLYLKYKRTGTRYLTRKLMAPVLLSILCGGCLLYLVPVTYEKHGTVFLFLIRTAVIASVYAVIGNLLYLYAALKGKIRRSGAAISHTGFGLLLLGVLISASQKEILSLNQGGANTPLVAGGNEPAGENITLLKGIPTEMEQYMVTYQSDSMHSAKPLKYYTIHFEQKNSTSSFNLVPNAFVNYKGMEGLISNPDARHFWDHDIFVYVTSIPDPAQKKPAASIDYRLTLNDTVRHGNTTLLLDSLTTRTNINAAGLQAGDSVSIARIRLQDGSQAGETAEPILIKRNGQSYLLPDTATRAAIAVRLTETDGKKASITIEDIRDTGQYVTLKAYRFPFINMLWIGTAVTIAGFLISAINRSRRSSTAK